MDLSTLTIHEAHERLKNRDFSAGELTQTLLKRIEEVEPKVKAYIIVTSEKALKEAEQADMIIAAGKIAPLTGIPLAIKDVLCTEGITTTCGSKILSNFVPVYDATVVRNLKRAGAITLGKANMDEFAMGSSTENSSFGHSHNPWDLSAIPGGSSGGSAAAVAADECIASLGTDTGGSIRQPASCCGVVGLKPTYGRVSRFGLIAFGSSLDQVGPLTKDVRDAALLMNVLAGYDPQDSTSVNKEVPDYTTFLKPDLKEITIGVAREYFIEGIDPEVEKAVREALNVLQSLGAKTVDIALPHTEYALPVYYLIAPAEASSNLARYDGVKYGFRTEKDENLTAMYKKTRSEGFGAEVKRRIMLGTYALSAGYYDAYYGKASQVRTLIRRDFEEAFKKCDVIVTPTTPTPAFKIGEKVDDPLQMYLSDIFTIPANLAGNPGISVPCGLTGNGLPIGLQVISGPFEEGKVLQTAFAYEQNTEWHVKKPKF
ncbi:MAG: Asp-tRNA(Asn)/Glu-tRNA(Gln) amidotransferase subunit GatA [Thermodesulfobacteriota bacterium]|jgi:aspartyl-tRNA(Asn)/glutamyl-tRNA(Gln) amidotransferase subunit A|nr:MAG: Asp-tRNA(Asn)/Glu-tRNA(Gln) amidotransferase subunit GatA [Thermodesulfobacteriota bacterium]